MLVTINRALVNDILYNISLFTIKMIKSLIRCHITFYSYSVIHFEQGQKIIHAPFLICIHISNSMCM